MPVQQQNQVLEEVVWLPHNYYNAYTRGMVSFCSRLAAFFTKS